MELNINDSLEIRMTIDKLFDKNLLKRIEVDVNFVRRQHLLDRLAVAA